MSKRDSLRNGRRELGLVYRERTELVVISFEKDLLKVGGGEGFRNRIVVHAV